MQRRSRFVVASFLLSVFLKILNDNHFQDVRADIARSVKEVHPLMMTDVYEKFHMCDAIDLDFCLIDTFIYFIN